MKGKVAFVLGAAVGYVLGARAGRARYEQIKSGAESMWNSEPVQKGVEAVREAAGTRVDELKTAAARAGKDAFSTFTRTVSGSQSGSGDRSQGEQKDGGSQTAAQRDSGSSTAQSTSSAKTGRASNGSSSGKKTASKASGSSSNKSSGKGSAAKSNGEGAGA